jgi:16S rRNA (guanine966-N2)-methyltransferase
LVFAKQGFSNNTTLKWIRQQHSGTNKVVVKKTNKNKTVKGRNQVRIIAGQWRGRKITFTDMPELRPTSDRIRETVFNWLSPYVEHSHCLDLFAGSGILSIEALSRQALSVTLVEIHSNTIKQVQAEMEKLSASNYALHHQDALTFITGTVFKAKNYNLVFLDPPYTLDMLYNCIQHLEKKWQELQPDFPILIYCEDNKPFDKRQFPDNWIIRKEKKAGQVHFCLLERHT